ncbi:MAG TPA: hypothetical protein V6D17_19665, partial [Candidatus Obscuribacterales bacterium]
MSLKNADQVGQVSAKNKNRAILWARYIVDSSDWLLLSVRQTESDLDDRQKQNLVSIAILAPSGKVMLQALIRAAEFSAREAIEGHGIDYSVLLEARACADVFREVEALIEKKQVLTWDIDATQKVLDAAAREHKCQSVRLAGTSVGLEFARFNGRVSRTSRLEVESQLPFEARSALAECQAMHTLIKEMAGTPQILDALGASPSGWTAEFYRPK